jgi:hypothetical protein
MKARVICVSRTLASGGETVGKLVADQLGFRYIDEGIIAHAADLAGVNPGLIAAAEHRKPLLDRLCDALAASTRVERLQYAPPVLEGMGYYGSEIAPLVPALPADFHALIREAISEIAAQGEAVIVAHAASMALAGAEGVLRVLVTAPEPTRAERLLASGQAPSEGEAIKAVKQSDRERRDYLRDFYSVNEELATHYDVVINSDFLPADRAVAVVLAAARSLKGRDDS